MNKNWIWVILILIITVIGGLFVTPGNFAKKIGLNIPKSLQKPFKLGLDLQGGAHLLYEADMSKIKKSDRGDTMDGLRDVIERRVNLFGVQEPVVQVEQAGGNYRLIVELAGVSDVKKAIDMIGQTPTLEFRTEMPLSQKKQIAKMLPESQIKQIIDQVKKETDKKITKDEVAQYLPLYNPSELTGKYLKTAKVEFDQNTFKPYIGLEFNSEGAKIFQKLTKENVGKVIAIYIDNQVISSPTVQEEIKGGRAQITGEFTIDQAKGLATNLSAGALPVPIKLISQQTIGPSLGQESVQRSISAGLFGFLLVILFMVVFYKASGLLSSLSLLFYAVILITLFKLIPVTLTLSGIAGLILSLGMAVDADVLVFERLREEFGEGIDFEVAVKNAFNRAWPAVRDGHLTTLITSGVLFLFASGFVQGFALTLALGMIVSMFSSMVITRLFVLAFKNTRLAKHEKIWVR
jgi:protein-export membrane protein SecD